MNSPDRIMLPTNDGVLGSPKGPMPAEGMRRHMILPPPESPTFTLLVHTSTNKPTFPEWLIVLLMLALIGYAFFKQALPTLRYMSGDAQKEMGMVYGD